MYKPQTPTKTPLSRTEVEIGEPIEHKIKRILNNQEPISDGAPIIYTERKDGVNPAHDIRTDRFEIAVDAMDKTAKTAIAKRKERLEKLNQETKGAEGTPPENTPKSGDPSL